MIEHLRNMHSHMAWADSRTLESLIRTNGEPATARGIYAHVLGAEHVWLARLRGERASLAVWPELDMDGCARLARQNAEAIGSFISTLGAADLEREVAYTNSAGLPFRSKVADIVLHLFLHGTYHRGQVALLLRSSGAIPEPTDYIAFVRGAPSATRHDRAPSEKG